MTRPRKFSDTDIENGAYVEIGGGSQLAQVLRYRRDSKWKQYGYDVLPMNNGTGDAYGVYSSFIPETFIHVADMTRWQKSKDNRYWHKVTPAYVPSGDGDATGGGPYTSGSAIEESGGDD